MQPDITIAIERAEEQPVGVQRFALGICEQDVMYEVTVTCPHGTATLMVAIGPTRLPGKTGEPTAEEWAEGARLLGEQLGQRWPQHAMCACSNAYWLRHGDQHIVQPEASVPVVGHCQHSRYSAN